jgi:4'-phosphopantetheinyl transferase EntD
MAGHSDTIAAMRRLLPPGAVIRGGGLCPRHGIIFPEEEKFIAGAAEKRRREFYAGRIYARRGLLELGQHPVPILPAPSRAPVWPDGFVGSISHCASVCAAIVARTASVRGIGVDIDDAAPLGSDVADLVCRPADVTGRRRQEALLGIDLPKLVFVAKEAFYKLYHPMTGVFLDFSDVELIIDPWAREFEARLANGGPPVHGRRHFHGKFGRHDRTIFAVAALP